MSTYKTLHEFGMNEIIIDKSTFIGYANKISILLSEYSTPLPFIKVERKTIKTAKITRGLMR